MQAPGFSILKATADDYGMLRSSPLTRHCTDGGQESTQRGEHRLDSDCTAWEWPAL